MKKIAYCKESTVYEHDFNVVKFTDEEDDYDDKYFSNQFRKVDGAWIIVEYSEDKCEFCEGYNCDRIQCKDELNGLLEEVSSQVGRADHKRFTMYKKFTFVKHGLLGSMLMREVDAFVQDLIILTFPVL